MMGVQEEVARMMSSEDIQEVVFEDRLVQNRVAVAHERKR